MAEIERRLVPPLSKNTITRWCVEQGKRSNIPNIYDVWRVAIEAGVSPAFFAFGENTNPLSSKEVDALKLLDLIKDDERAYQAGLDVWRRFVEEEAIKGVKEPEKKIRRVNRRDELAVYHSADNGKHIPCYSGIAAGPGRVLERCSDVVFVREHIPGSNLSSARVAGESMLDTLQRGDRVLLREYATPYELEPISEADEKGSVLQIKSEIPDDSIWVLSINREEPTLKRITHEGSHADWRLIIEADNRDEWKPYTKKRGDVIHFHAKLLGLIQ